MSNVANPFGPDMSDSEFDKWCDDHRPEGMLTAAQWRAHVSRLQREAYWSMLAEAQRREERPKGDPER